MSFLDVIKQPPKQFSPAAFWFWYDELKPDEMRRQINMMAEQGVHNAFMHARAYLKTQYLEEDWWKAVAACIDEGKKIGFYPWLYDEYAWPSGTAGSTFQYGYQKWSRTLSKGECNMAKYLSAKRYTSFDEFCLDRKDKSLVAAFFVKDGKWQLIYDEASVQGGITAFYYEYSQRFVDYLNPDTIKEFISYTHEEYKKRFGEFFGNVVPGIFFDEIFMIAKMPWTWRFADEFKNRMGYDIIPHLYALTEDGEEERRIRNDYFTVVSQLYEEAFFVQISKWCRENSLELTGHIEEHFSQHPGRQGQFFNNMRHLDIPGADCHDYRYRFPRKITYREPKFAVSVGRAYGKKRMMSEAFGGAGWGCSLQQYKRGVNTLGAMGINMITLHGFYSQCVSQGEQADWPASFFFQNPYWRYFKHMADYMGRICYMNSLGEPIVDVGLYYPIDEMQKETVFAAPTKNGMRLDEAWNGAMNALIENQIDVDMIDEESILLSRIEDGRLLAGVQKFRVILCPDVMEPSYALRTKLEEFERSGGRVVYYACGDESDKAAVKTEDLPSVIEKMFMPDVKVISGARDNLYVNHRKIEDKEVYFIASSAKRARSIKLMLREKGAVRRISPEDGCLSSVSYKITGNGTEAELSLEPDEACWLIVYPSEEHLPFNEEIIREELSVMGKWEFLPIGKEISGSKQPEIDECELEIPIAAFSSKLHPDSRRIRIKNTASEKGNVGRHLSLWDANWITRRFDWTDSSMKKELYLRRRFELEASPDKAVMCIASVNEWTLWINGKRIAESKEARKPLDIDIRDHLRAGENLIAVKVTNNTPMEHFNLLSVDALRPEEMISLLAQAKITMGDKIFTLITDETWEANDNYIEGWEKIDYRPEIYLAHSTDSQSFGDNDIRWTQSWNRGCPPMLPWGDLPLFGENITYPQLVSYSIILPAGTKSIYYPKVSGSDIRITVDGIEPVWENGACRIKNNGLTHQLQIVLNAESAADGLSENVRVCVSAFRDSLCDWRLYGLEWYSGFARYRNRLNVNKKQGRYLLDLGRVSFQAEVWVNGKHAGDRVWEPYRLDVTDLIKEGENDFVIIVSNSAAVERQFMLVDEGAALGWNRYWNEDNIRREGENLVSGLEGPVMLIRKETPDNTY
ncbi:MAG: hypothetical protein E7334_00150 [Clostridiales bacterium]|nr:hypothetical protein [Clostridiales bacterium]